LASRSLAPRDLSPLLSGRMPTAGQKWQAHLLVWCIFSDKSHRMAACVVRFFFPIIFTEVCWSDAERFGVFMLRLWETPTGALCSGSPISHFRTLWKIVRFL
jgi:hypothetical protein